MLHRFSILCMVFLLATQAIAHAETYYETMAPERKSIYNRRHLSARAILSDSELESSAGAAAYSRGDYVAAYQRYEEALSLTQSYALWHNYGCALMALEDAGSALPRLRYYDPEIEEVIDEEDVPWALKAVTAFDCAAGWLAYEKEAPSCDLLRARGAAAFDSEDYEAALAAWWAAQATPEGKDDNDLAINIGTALLRLDRNSEAEEAFERALEAERKAGLNPSPDLLAKLGAAEYFIDKPEQALATSLKALELLEAAGTDSPQLHQVLAGIYSTLDRHEESLAATERSIELRAQLGWSPDPDLASLRGLTLYEMQRWPEAADALMEAYDLYGHFRSFPEIRELALALHSQGRTAEAITALDREASGRNWPGDPAALMYSLLGTVAYNKGDHTQALADFETARKLAGLTGEVLSHEEEVRFSVVLEEAHRDSEAIEALRRAETAALAAGNDPIPNYAWYRARLLLDKGDPSAVYKEYLAGQTIVEEHDIELDADMHLLRGWLRLMHNEMQDALADANAAEALVRKEGLEPTAGVYLLKAVVLGMWGQNTASRELFNSAATQLPDDPQLAAAMLLLDGAVQVERGDRKSGCKKLREALSRLAELGEPLDEATAAGILASCPVE